MIYDFMAPFLFIIMSFFISTLLVTLNDIFISYKIDFNKNAPYECGFQPFDTNIQQFDIKYYLVALLFLLFDVETVFLVPLILIFNSLNYVVFFNFLFFLFVLFIGLFYEWKNNFLEWE